MLYVLLIFIIVFGFLWLVIFPQMDTSSALTSTIDELETQKFPVEAAVQGLDRMESNLSEAQSNYDSAMKDFYPYMENYEIDRMLTGIMMDDYGLTVLSLNMSDVPSGITVPYYQGIDPNAETAAESSADTTESTESSAVTEDGEDASNYIPVLTSSVTISAEGSRQNLQNFVDSLFTDYPSLRVSSYSITDEDVSQLDLSIDLYMKTA